jgi:hypothetical protein
VSLHHDVVEVTLGLPTYWCSPNFSYLMMEDIDRALQQLPWTADVRVTLVGHESADALNHAIRNRLPFEQAFADATDDLSGLRRVFQDKAFYARQKRLIDALRDQVGVAVEPWLPGRVEDVVTWVTQHPALEPVWGRYQKALTDRHLAHHPAAPVVVDLTGRPISRDQWPHHWRRIRLTALNMDSSEHICRGLHQSRYDPERIQPELRLPLIP